MEHVAHSYLHECRALTIQEIRRCLPRDTRHAAGLYDVMLDYPLRPAKALRPALCIAICRAIGGNTDQALPSAGALELFHNACLVHDDVEDFAHKRRHGLALHLAHGTPVAINVGDAMLALSLQPLLDNVRVLGLGPALRIFEVFSRMARESVEGQMLELSWVREGRWDLKDRDYVRMVHKKTGWYSFIAPIQMGCIAAGGNQALRAHLGRFGLCLGVAFQIKDDLLSLQATEATTGKDTHGDLWEGKYTLPLLHALRSLPEGLRLEVIASLRLNRAVTSGRATDERLRYAGLLRKIDSQLPGLDWNERQLLRQALTAEPYVARTQRDVQRLHDLVTGRQGASLAYAHSVARRFARRAARSFARALGNIPDSAHKAFLMGLVDYVTERSN